MTGYHDILYTVDHGVATITLNRPDRLNAYTDAMGRSLKQAIHDAAIDRAVRVVVLTGAGRGFCAGADMDLLQAVQTAPAQGTGAAGPAEVPDPPEEADLPLGDRYAGRWSYFIKCRKPIIAAINGPAAGLGLVLALYCDLRFAARSAKFTTAFASRGLIAEHGIAWLLPRLVGPAHAMDLLLSARKIGAEEALRMGLVNEVHEDADFAAKVGHYARHLAEAVSPRSAAVMKAQGWKALLQSYGEALALADVEMLKSFRSEDFREGVAHFVEKRPPRFPGR